MPPDVSIPTLVDAQPFMRPDSASVWRRSNQTRDAIYATLLDLAARMGFAVLIRRSPDFVYPNWVSMHAWLPTDDPAVTRRVGFVMELAIAPHHRFDVTFTIKLFKDTKERVLKPLMSWDEGFLRECMSYLLKDTDLPRWHGRKIREHGLALWRPANVMEAIRTTTFPVKPLGWLLLLLGAGCVFLSAQDRGPLIDGIAVSMARNGLLARGARYVDLPRIFLEYAVLFLVPAIALLILAARRKVYTMSSDRPDGQPRDLRTADSWSTLLPRIGRQQDEARRRFVDALRAGAGDKRLIRQEAVSYVTPNGPREREQIVLTDGRSILFCHIYAYEADLLIGWDAHLNVGEWAEKKLAEGVHRRLHKRVVLNTVVPGTVRLNEYDLIDLNGLVDWAHSNLVQVVKALVAENKLDDEIDFTIVRGERQGLLRQSAEPGQKKKRFSPVTPAA